MKFNFKKIPYFIAEVGVNHENNINLAEKIIKQASIGGASAVKFQTYKAELLASKNSPAYWDKNKVRDKSQYELFKKFDKFNEDDYIKLKKICDHYKVDFLSTPFDDNSAELLNKLVKYFKLASADITNRPLLDKIISFKKAIIYSTGASNIHEITETYNYIKKRNSKIDIGILHCILAYPTHLKDCNLNLITFLKSKFKSAYIGISDHAIPDKNMLVLTKAYDLGAVIIEKHFTENMLKGKKNNDHFHSINSYDLKIFFDNINILKKISGKIYKTRFPFKSELNSRKYARRSMYTCKNIKKNEIFTKENLIPKRPGLGISPLHVSKIYGKKSRIDIGNDKLLKWSHLY
jgi:N-acetylneuraminate synthase